MFFGLPWYAIVAIVAIVGGLLYDYKEKELQAEEKRMGNLREFKELQQTVHNLRSRIENLEHELARQRANSSSNTSGSLRDIEIDDEVEEQNTDNSASKIKNRN